jgi:23S rRNA (adenine-N6)-dimethyltransferase
VPARRPPPAWGWHALTDAWAARIVADAQVRPGQLVVDVGAGHGALTAPLVAVGARVIAVELHPGRARRLERRFAEDPVVVLRSDATQFQLPVRPFRVVANPPYAVTSPLLRLLLAPRSRLTAADLILQRAAARRVVEGRMPGAERWARHWSITIGRALPRTAFQPRPRVDSVVLVIRRRLRP